MDPKTIDAHIELTPGVVGGRPQIAGRRIAVQHVAVWHERIGQSAEEIAAEHDLSLADVYAALAYYHDHRDEIDAAIREDASLADAFERENVSQVRRRLDG